MFKKNFYPHDEAGTTSTVELKRRPTTVFEDSSQRAAPPRMFYVQNEVQTESEPELSEHSPPTLEREEPETTIGSGVMIRGYLAFQRYLHIDGAFEGELDARGKLVVGPSGRVKADINLDTVIIEGEVEGNIQVRECELRGEAKVRGDIEAKLLSIDTGVTVEGTFKVNPCHEVIDSDS